MPSTVPLCASTTANVSGVVLAQAELRRPGSRGLPRRNRSSCASARGAARRARAPRRRASRGRRRRRGASKAAARTWPSRTRGFAWSRIAASTLRSQQRLRLAHEVLVERVLARDEHGEAVPAPARASPLLAQRRDGARESRPRWRSRAGRCRCPARARRSRRRRAARPRRAAARCRVAAPACSRRGTERAACPWPSRRGRR